MIPPMYIVNLDRNITCKTKQTSIEAYFSSKINYATYWLRFLVLKTSLKVPKKVVWFTYKMKINPTVIMFQKIGTKQVVTFPIDIWLYTSGEEHGDVNAQVGF